MVIGVTVKLGSSALDVAGRAGTEDEGDLGEGKARAQRVHST